MYFSITYRLRDEQSWNNVVPLLLSEANVSNDWRQFVRDTCRYHDLYSDGSFDEIIIGACRNNTRLAILFCRQQNELEVHIEPKPNCGGIKNFKEALIEYLDRLEGIFKRNSRFFKRTIGQIVFFENNLFNSPVRRNSFRSFLRDQVSWPIIIVSLLSSVAAFFSSKFIFGDSGVRDDIMASIYVFVAQSILAFGYAAIQYFTNRSNSIEINI